MDFRIREGFSEEATQRLFDAINGKYVKRRFINGNDINGVKEALEGGADVNAVDEYGETPLHHAVKNDRSKEVVKCLIAAGASVNARDKEGQTPLHTAVFYRNEAVVETLAKNMDTNLNAVNDCGYTPLLVNMCIQMDSNTERPEGSNIGITKILIREGADIHHTTKRGNRTEDGLNYIDYALIKKESVLDAELLVRCGVDPSGILERKKNVPAKGFSEMKKRYENITIDRDLVIENLSNYFARKIFNSREYVEKLKQLPANVLNKTLEDINKRIERKLDYTLPMNNLTAEDVKNARHHISATSMMLSLNTIINQINKKNIQTNPNGNLVQTSTEQGTNQQSR